MSVSVKRAARSSSAKSDRRSGSARAATKAATVAQRKGKAARDELAKSKASRKPKHRAQATKSTKPSTTKTGKPTTVMSKSSATARSEAPKAPLPKKATAPSRSAAEKPAQPRPAAVRPVPAMPPVPAFQKKPLRPPVPSAAPRLAEVAPAEEVDYAEGDYVVYPTHGVGRVIGIEQQVISGHKLRLIAIKFEKDRMTLRVPVAKAQESGLRKLSTRKVMDSALAALKGKVRIKRTMWSRRAQEYEAKINSGDPVSIAEVVRDLHRGSDQPDQSYSERQMYQAALDRLAREFAAVEKIDEATAAERLEELLKAA